MRWNLMGLAFAASCAAAAPQPAPGPVARIAPPAIAPQANDGEALYKKMEAALAAAKKLTLSFTSTTESSAVNGSFTVEEGNKLDMKVEGTIGAKKYTLEITCDGKLMNLKRTETPPPPVPLKPQPALLAPNALSAQVAAALARGGAWLAQEFADGEYRAAAQPFFAERQQNSDAKPKSVPGGDITSRHVLGNFQLGKPGGAGTPVTYELSRQDGSTVLVTVVTVWVDAKSSMPLKREGAIYTVTSDGKKSAAPLAQWAETYEAKAE